MGRPQTRLLRIGKCKHPTIGKFYHMLHQPCIFRRIVQVAVKKNVFNVTMASPANPPLHLNPPIHFLTQMMNGKDHDHIHPRKRMWKSPKRVSPERRTSCPI
ncbi:hypothetical protein CLF_110872 [Clonorchis sinensis]|uniref:Uncharacterized protein n=1 Tax=Clonorchis sinensis TaxID=79923 RepID=G7YL81_CLOSI|nr:hypothetical protein CLF_110872 [Clonorchis sinensis]